MEILVMIWLIMNAIIVSWGVAVGFFLFFYLFIFLLLSLEEIILKWQPLKSLGIGTVLSLFNIGF